MPYRGAVKLPFQPVDQIYFMAEVIMDDAFVS